VGTDAFLGLTSWHRWHELTDYCHMVVMNRPGAKLPEQGELADFIRQHQVMDAGKLGSQAAGLLLFHQVSQLEISATAIRKLLGSGGEAGFLLPERVLDIIRSEGVYATGDG
jgi:nicotinate-nucleotide adenylyltransferase